MFRSRRFRLLSRVGLPLLALLVLAAPVSAASWNPPVLIGTSSNGVAWMNSLAVTANGTAIAVFSDAMGPAGIYGVFLVRSTSSGNPWSKAHQVSVPGSCSASAPAISANGSNVDMAWLDYSDCTSGYFMGAVWYAHSVDNGKTFAPPKKLSPITIHLGILDVGSASDGTVVVGWTEDETGSMYVRTSTDYGSTFKARQTIGVTTAHPFEIAPDRLDGSVTVAVGDGVAYVGYLSNQSTIKVRRSVDAGTTWSAPFNLATNADGFSEPDLAAEDSHAVLAFAATNGSTDWARYRQTNDSGATWPATTDVTTKNQPKAWYTAISLSGGTVRLAYTRCITQACANQAVYYTQRAGTGSWTVPVRVSQGGGSASLGAFTAGVGAANGNPIVVYFTQNGLGTFVHARSKV